MQDEDEREFVAMDGYRVRRGKEEFARALFVACRRLRFEREGRPNLRRLAESMGRAPHTLINALVSKGIPEIPTLQDLEEASGISVEDALVALHVIPPRGQAQGLSAAQHRILQAMRGLQEDVLNDLGDLILQLRARGRLDNNHGPSPTA